MVSTNTNNSALDEDPTRRATGTSPPRVLIAGATGYVGGRLLRALEERDVRVRCIARRPQNLSPDAHPSTEVVQGDVVSGEGLSRAFEGIHTAYYLVHSMGSARSFEEEDRKAATYFGEHAVAAGVRRIVYLGGIADESRPLSPHLRSRVEVGRILRESGIPVIELRASIVIGSGSLSFEMIRSLVEHLPVLITPRWVSTPAQPIGIDDLLAYLVQSLDIESNGSRIFEIGGKDPMSYGDLMAEYARQKGVRRWQVRVPVLTPYLSSLWLGLVTPLYARVGRKLIESIEHPTIVRDNAARHLYKIEPTTVAEAIARALRSEDRDFAETRWSDAVSAAGTSTSLAAPGGVDTRLTDSREANSTASPARAFVPIRSIGGETGWYGNDSLWKLRGFLDLLVGGVGMRRLRRHPHELKVGDIVDCWRVAAFDPDRFLRLEAEMRLPGRAWLEFEVAPVLGGGSLIRQTASFEPRGLAGQAYWYGIYPLHELVFGGMIDGIRRAANALQEADVHAPDRSSNWPAT